MRRLCTVLLAVLAWQAAASTAPARALIVSVGEDGRAGLGCAVPGTSASELSLPFSGPGQLVAVLSRDLDAPSNHVVLIARGGSNVVSPVQNGRCAEPEQTTTTEEANVSRVEASLRDIRRDLLNGKIEATRILFVPYEIATIAALTPELLDRTAKFNRQVEVDDKLKNSLVKAIDDSRLSAIEYPPDVRWGAVFYDRTGRAIHSIYLNGRMDYGTGRRGIIDGGYVGLNGALIEWFQGNWGNSTSSATTPGWD